MVGRVWVYVSVSVCLGVNMCGPMYEEERVCEITVVLHNKYRFCSQHEPLVSKCSSLQQENHFNKIVLQRGIYFCMGYNVGIQ